MIMSDQEKRFMLAYLIQFNFGSLYKYLYSDGHKKNQIFHCSSILVYSKVIEDLHVEKNLDNYLFDNFCDHQK